MRLDGIHHVTCITGDAPRNVEYYTGVLGLRLVKKSVNQDDPTILTFPLMLTPPWDWTYQWDSRGASAGVIPVHAQTEDGQPMAAVDAEFRLKANRANKELTGDWWL